MIPKGKCKKKKMQVCFIILLFKEMPTEGGLTASGSSQLLVEIISWEFGKGVRELPFRDYLKNC